MVDRIKQVMEYYKETPAGFSEAIGISRSNLAHLFSGRNQPSLDCAKKVLNAYPEISTEWLIMGVGPMINDSSEMVVQKPVVTQRDLFANFDDEEPVGPDNSVSSKAEASSTAEKQVQSDELEETEQNPPLQNQPQIEPKTIESKQIRTRRQVNSSSSESKISHRSVQGQGISDSRGVQFDNEKRVTKIIFFYDDDSFKIYHP